MKLLIQRTSEPSNLISDAEIADLRQLLSEFDAGLQEELNELEDEEVTELALEDAAAEMEDEAELGGTAVSETESEYIIELTAPGFDREDFIVELSDDGILSVNAMTATEQEVPGLFEPLDETENALSCSFRLPEDANGDDIEASYDNERLLISIGKN